MHIADLPPQQRYWAEIGMTHCNTPAIVLRRRDYGDFDVILTILTREFGKQTLIAKAAKKSTKRFPGILEPFTELQVLFRLGRRKGMPVLQEASLIRPFSSIRADIVKTAYASYWAELIVLWVEEGQCRTDIYHLLASVLDELVAERMSAPLLSILFQMRFIGQEGFEPVMERCTCCQAEISKMVQQNFCIDLSQGGVVCDHCPPRNHGHLKLSKGTLKQLQWVVRGDLATARRVRFGAQALNEATAFLESFVPYHIGRTPKSLQFLQQLRS